VRACEQLILHSQRGDTTKKSAHLISSFTSAAAAVRVLPAPVLPPRPPDEPPRAEQIAALDHHQVTQRATYGSPPRARAARRLVLIGALLVVPRPDHHLRHRPHHRSRHYSQPGSPHLAVAVAVAVAAAVAVADCSAPRPLHLLHLSRALGRASGPICRYSIARGSSPTPHHAQSLPGRLTYDDARRDEAWVTARRQGKTPSFWSPRRVARRRAALALAGKGKKVILPPPPLSPPPCSVLKTKKLLFFFFKWSWPVCPAARGFGLYWS